MRHVFSASLALLVAFPAFAADPKPNTLTPKEIAEGWLLLFDGKDGFGWEVSDIAEIIDGTFRLAGKDLKAQLTTAFGEYDLELEYWVNGPGQARYRVFRGNDPTTGIGFVPAKEPGWSRATYSVRFFKEEQITEFRFYSPTGTLLHKGSERTQRSSPAGHVAFTVDAKAELSLRNIKLRPHGLALIFNGKDLTGWKEHPGRKSKFSVTKNGWINVKDGSGDLQTEGQWGNFVLQLECISNGKHLNSGIFFRCRPNEYQQGYEAQIRNQFTEDPTQKYVVEEYDPKTHELKGKKEILSPAIDYGTGAIYRRQPARRGVAKDGEWFTLTVVAHGRHFATWVNGIQVTDWTDNRKPNDNARNGYRAEKGPISIQGHDPTTDLSFRNLRIVELP